jgi:hypothetical protein
MATFPHADLAQFLFEYPGFTHHSDAGDSCLIGTVTFPADGKQYTYEVRIVASTEYPQRFPKVFETVSTFPKIIDWHVYGDESFCFTVPPIEVVTCKKGITLVTFLQRWLIPYLANQQYRKNEGRYANGEYGHDIWGLLEFYHYELKMENPILILRALEMALQRKRVQRVSLCFCGSKLKYRHCHRKGYEMLLQLDDEMLLAHHNLYTNLLAKLRAA